MKTKLFILFALATLSLSAKEYHVAITGNDKNDGLQKSAFRTINHAAQIAVAGDIITVHAGTYREWVNPANGGESDAKRIVYRAARDEKVEIKGSEIVKKWEKVNEQSWKTVIQNSFFCNFNPYNDYINGDWYINIKKRKLHTGAIYLNGQWFSEANSVDEVLQPTDRKDVWFAKVDDKETTIYAHFGDKNPNTEMVEINVRPTVFYPKKIGVNYITVRGFSMSQAATPWAPPTAEQKAIIGTNWSKGWIIENNNVSYSICCGISLGKYSDEYDNTSANSAEGYVKTVERALQNGWSKENIGHHIVRNNEVSHCEQTGIVGSLGCAFSTITNNVVHDINVMNWYFGYEMAGIKFHGAIDMVINHNHIYRCNRGIWLDWMAQGAMITNNLLHDNDRENGYDQADIYMEVNRGPALISNNLFLSERSILNMSNGSAFVHNLTSGSVINRREEVRATPCLKPHSTQMGDVINTLLGDDRWYSNIISGNAANMKVYDNVVLPVKFGGNVFCNGTVPCIHDASSLVLKGNPQIKITEENDGFYLEMMIDEKMADNARTTLITTDLLGKTKYTNQSYTYPDGRSLEINTDYFGRRRNKSNPFPGPFEKIKSGKVRIKVW
jgi:alpha-L-arabinofuranosidase